MKKLLLSILLFTIVNFGYSQLISVSTYRTVSATDTLTNKDTITYVYAMKWLTAKYVSITIFSDHISGTNDTVYCTIYTAPMNNSLLYLAPAAATFYEAVNSKLFKTADETVKFTFIYPPSEAYLKIQFIRTAVAANVSKLYVYLSAK